MKLNRDSSAELRFAHLAQTVKDWAAVESEHAADAHALEWIAIERSLLGGQRRQRRMGASSAGRRLIGVTAVAAFAVLALMLVRGFGRSQPERESERRISFVVFADGASKAAGDPAVGDTLAKRPTRLPTRVAFSDGSEVVLQPGARGTVVATTTRGARVRLDEGRARFAVTHRPQADWSVDVGPFVVLVHGTVFDLDWAKHSGTFVVDLIAGAITVKGPMPGGQVTLTAGQRLTAAASTGRSQIGQIGPIGYGLETPSDSGPQIDPALPDLANTSPVKRSPRHRHADPGRAAPKGGQLESASAASRLGRIAEVAATWEARVATGAFQSVVADADAMGVGRCLAYAPVGALGALADAARYVRRTDLARRAFLAERSRFGGTVAAHDAAFLIGRLAEDASGNTREALLWYDRYLEEGERGTYASEALGRKMLALDRLGQDADARSTAETYLETYPHGAFAVRARRIRDR
ncbi:MAG: FecR domain-containing protein [Deltaproteobacteria bacterium]|nr:FecR domain-containing protein [Deltaproteobacteria bacterium]